MIQYPINPKTNTFDATGVADQFLRMTFQGDILTYEHFKIFDYDTGEVVWDALYGKNDMSPIAYNGQQVTLSFGSSRPCTNGRRYVWQVSMTQKTVDGSAFINDMPVLSGRIRKTSTGTSIYIVDGLTTIYPWGKTSNVYSRTLATGDIPTNNMTIKIGEEERNIISYETGVTIDDAVYGVITIDSAFTDTVSLNDNYCIYSSFVISPQYFFKCESTPTVAISHTCYGNRIYCSGAYSQAENVPIKYFRYKLYWSNNAYFLDENTASGYKKMLISDTGKIYSQDMQYEFMHPYRHDWTTELPSYIDDNDYYRIECELVTQNDLVCEHHSDFELDVKPISDIGESPTDRVPFMISDFTLSWDRNLGAVIYRLRGYGAKASRPAGDYMLFRTDITSGETTALQMHFLRREGDYDQILVGCDLSAPCRGNYRYSIALFDTDGRLIKTEVATGAPYVGTGTLPNTTIEVSEYAYYIIDLDYIPDTDAIYHPTRLDDERETFRLNNVWKFAGEIQNTTVANNLDRIVHVGYNQYISSTSTEVNYMSGTLSAMLGYVNCATKNFIDTISLVRAWRNFITQQKPFMLKSQKGDVWIVNVSDNPTTQYEEMQRDLLTTFSFSWAECSSINDVTIYGVPVPTE